MGRRVKNERVEKGEVPGREGPGRAEERVHGLARSPPKADVAASK